MIGVKVHLGMAFIKINNKLLLGLMLIACQFGLFQILILSYLFRHLLVCPNVSRTEEISENGGEHCYKIFRYKQDYMNAKQMCEDEGAVLVSIGNQEEHVS